MSVPASMARGPFNDGEGHTRDRLAGPPHRSRAWTMKKAWLLVDAQISCLPMGRKRIAGTLTLASPLPLQQTALGVRVTLRVSDFVVGVTTPGLDPADPHKLAAPQPLVRARRTVHTGYRGRILMQPDHGWGSSRSPAMCFAWRLHLDVLAPESTDAYDIAQLIQPQLAGWAESLADWLVVRAPTSVAVGLQAVPAARVSLDDSHEVPHLTLVRPKQEPRGATLEEYFDSVHRSSCGGPSLSHALLVQSEQGRWHDERREAVIDAGSAAEVALSSSITRTLMAQGLPKSLVEPVISQANGLADLLRLNGDLGNVLGVSRSAVLSNLANPRNRAVHTGERPSGEATLKAVNTARLVVEDADPLPALRRNGARRVVPIHLREC